MKYFSHLNTAVRLLQQYRGDEPFEHFSKAFFKQHKKYGSGDRKNITHLCYCYFRLGKALTNIPVEEKVLAALFLCSATTNELLQNLKPRWNESVNLSIKEKLQVINNDLSLLTTHYSPLITHNIFPWKDQLSEGIDYESFCTSLLVQPNLFLRLRPGKEPIVKQQLQTAGIAFKVINDTCLALPNNTKLDEAIALNKDAVVQDYSSQRVGELLREIRLSTALNADESALSRSQRDSGPVNLWDCCAASGGKSILVYDILKNISITVSDIRPAILKNLAKRFEAAGIKNYNAFTADLSHSNFEFRISIFDIVLSDVPCSGSGTWGRTPEQLAFFEEQEIERYSELQKTITGNIIPHLKPGGYLLYITCSVFKKENEEVVQHLVEQHGLQLQRMELLKGYEQKADTLFAALLTA